MDFYNFYGGFVRPYWLHNYQPNQPPVLVVHMPVPGRFDSNCFKMDKSKSMKRTKSQAQKNRDFHRRQIFIEKKNTYAAMPFFGLQDRDFLNELQKDSFLLQEKNVSKLHSATRAIEKLQKEIHNLKLSNASFQFSLEDEMRKNKEINITLQKQSEEQKKLQDDLDFEKKRVVMFVAQNVDRQRDIVILREELTKQINLIDQLKDDEKRLCGKMTEYEKDRLNLESLLDAVKKKRLINNQLII